MDRALRGAGIGAVSMESEDGVEFAERVATAYCCEKGHTVIVPFALGAEVPDTWQCRCGTPARLGLCEDETDDLQQRRTRTHWDMLLERRTMPELEQLLEERLALLRAGRARLASA